jgi:hypothetical protein
MGYDTVMARIGALADWSRLYRLAHLPVDSHA